MKWKGTGYFVQELLDGKKKRYVKFIKQHRDGSCSVEVTGDLTVHVHAKDKKSVLLTFSIRNKKGKELFTFNQDTWVVVGETLTLMGTKIILPVEIQ
jgi:hypothetical protein